MKKKKSKAVMDPDFLSRQKEDQLRTHRQVIYLNKNELAAINEYCSRFKVRTRSVLYRQAILEKILKELGDNYPTLF